MSEDNCCKDVEVKNGKYIWGCDCVRRNGLQDSCLRLKCMGRPECLNAPLPCCCPGRLMNTTDPAVPSTSMCVPPCCPPFCHAPVCTMPQRIRPVYCKSSCPTSVCSVAVCTSPLCSPVSCASVAPSSCSGSRCSAIPICSSPECVVQFSYKPHRCDFLSMCGRGH